MKKLTDVYIKVTKQNQEELSKITHVGNLPIGEHLIYYDDVLSSFEFENKNGVEGLKKEISDTVAEYQVTTWYSMFISSKLTTNSNSKILQVEFIRPVMLLR